MRKYLILTASTVALTIAGAGFAAAQDKAGPARPLTPTSPGAGAIKKDESLKNDPAMEQRAVTKPIEDRARAADTSGYRSYNDNKAAFSGASIAGGLSAETLLGADVLNPSGDEIGEVEDLVIGADNKIETAIVEVGGFLGIGSKNVAVDIALLKQSPTKKGFVTTMTKEELKSRTEYDKKGGIWVQRYN